VKRTTRLEPTINQGKENTRNALTRRGSNSLFDDFFRDFAPGFFVQPLHGDPLPTQIRLDVQERDGAFEVQAEIPGVKKEDIEIDLNGNVLSLRAEVRQEDSQSREGRMMCKERYYGSVSRSVQLPAEIDESQAKARYENGVLKLTLPKKAGGRSQRLSIE
jgi:HSP20 family protein